MKKIKYSFVLILTLLVLIYSCDDPNFGIPNPFEGTDYEVLATENEEDIIKFLSTHYYNEVLDSIKPIENGETSLLNSDNLKIQQVNETIDNIDITFNLYTYVIEEGDGNVEHNEINGGKPTNIDSLLVNYSGRVLIPEGTVVIDGVETVVGNSLTTGNFDSGLTTWISSGILGWSYGFTNFKPGNIIINQGEKINFNGTGKGFIFIPSGLGYPSNLFDPRINRATDFPYDQVLVFKVELLDFVPDTDHDNDGVPSILESPDCDKNPRNDSNDKFFPGLADYLNPNITESFDCNR
jgi:hypothetical protein